VLLCAGVRCGHAGRTVENIVMQLALALRRYLKTGLTFPSRWQDSAGASAKSAAPPSDRQLRSRSRERVSFKSDH